MNGMDMLRIGVFCGNFAPIHNGHVASAKAFMEQMKLDYLFVVPRYIKPEEGRDVGYSPYIRMKMCQLAFEDTDGVVVSDAMVAANGCGDIYELISEFRREDARIFLLLGTDEVLNFEKNEKYEEILKICYPCYVRRESSEFISSMVISKISAIYQKNGVMFRRIVTEPLEISSDTVRNGIKNGENMSKYLPEKVEKYICDNGLYGAK